MTELPFLAATRDSYDTLAEGYTERMGIGPDFFGGRPIERALLGAFVELVRAAGGGRVADVGCGPGPLTDELHRAGLDVLGIDLSPGMVASARRAHPHLRFEVGSMTALDLPEASLGGLLAAHSIIHVPWEHRPRVFAEFRRVLAPGGILMLTFQVGEGRRHFDEAFGSPVDLDWYRQRPEEVTELLGEAGFEPIAGTVRRPIGREKTPHGSVLARVPAPA
ncbi:class I SAM-dependent methyltransferase [Streptomyces calidiresistens]|uniref:Methyltransferase domain-containing protein n=1 Tax=Streptomyces calidiresistens TaxID=1485586 RepID=A0A7W3XVQ0_9ACTN|nr:class I SAM-dependent methyltransferase [Streptomyces calidiresistens]MBB0229029.1 methyltransferase domain-containing protein [Streptomyces calidiresistens]